MIIACWKPKEAMANMTLIGIVVFMLLPVGAISADRKMYFGINGHPFFGYYQNKKFHKMKQYEINDLNKNGPLGRFLDQFKRRGPFQGFYADGTPIAVTIDTITFPSGGVGDPPIFRYKLKSQKRWRKGDIFYFTSNRKIRHIATESKTIDKKAYEMMRRAIISTVEKLLEPHSNDFHFTKLLSYAIKEPKINGPRGESDVVAVYWPIDIREVSKGDVRPYTRRGGAYFIFAKNTQRIVYSLYNVLSSSSGFMSESLLPILYFTIEGDGTVYMLAEYANNWEGYEYRIINFNNGKILLYAFVS